MQRRKTKTPQHHQSSRGSKRRSWRPPNGVRFSLLLQQYRSKATRPDDLRFAEDLAQLDCLTWRARHGKPGTRWVCLDEPFADFAARGEAELWQYDTEFPSAGVVKHWLLGQLFVATRESSSADGA